jgi:DNA-binding transcriptional LysR family regulator
MDRFEAMSMFLTAVDSGSLSAASRKLDVPLATVSRKIGELETRLKTRLLLRGGRKLILTDAGRSYIEACRKIVEDLIEAERTASGEYQAPTGELTISAPIVLGRTHILPIMHEFMQAYPDVSLRLHQGDRIVNLLEEDIDLAARIGRLPDSSLIATRIGMTRMVTCASPAYLKRRGTPKTPDELKGHCCITFDLLSSSAEWVYGHGETAITVPVRSRLTLSTADAVADTVLSGIGIGRVSYYAVESAVAAGKLQIILQDYEPPEIPISLVYPSQRLLPLKLRAFLDFAAPRLRKRLPQQTAPSEDITPLPRRRGSR